MDAAMENERDESELIARKIIKYIESENIGVGDRLPPIRKLSEMWGARQNVVRDAILRVQTMGMVTVLPRAGAFVRSVDLSPMVDAFVDTLHMSLVQEDVNLVHLLKARNTLEVELAGQAAENRRPENMFPLHRALETVNAARDDVASFRAADEQFHLEITKLSDNPVLVLILRSLLTLLRPHSFNIVPSSLTSEGKSLHNDIYQSILDGDAARARELMRAHLDPNLHEVLARLTEFSHPSSPVTID